MTYMTPDEEQRRLSRRRAAREMLEADVYAGALVNTFRGTRHEAEAEELARLVADSAVDASVLQRGAARSAEEVREIARTERQRAEVAVEQWFAEADRAQDS